MSNSALPDLSINDVINATVGVFNATGHRFPGSADKMAITSADLVSGREAYSEVRPYNIYRDVCIALCEMLVDEDMDVIHAAFPGTVSATDAAARARRTLKFGNPDYGRVHDRLVTVLLPKWLQLNYFSSNFCDVTRIVEPEAMRGRPLEKSPGPVTKGGLIVSPTMLRDKRTETASNGHGKKPAASTTQTDAPINSDTSPMPLNIDNIQKACVDAWNEVYKTSVSVADIQGRSQNSEIKGARQLSVYVCRRLLDANTASFSKLGDTIDRSETTIMHAFNIASRRVNRGDEIIKTILRKVLERVEHSSLAAVALMHPDIPYDAPKRRPASESPTGP